MYRVLLLGMLWSVLHIAPATSAQANRRCFDVPNVPHCIEGRFREYWETNGGLAIFGYPISPAREERTAAGTFLVQYFERNRFELHPEKARPYDVLLGRLGDDTLTRQGLQWRTFMASQRDETCLWFPETQQNICDHSSPFRSYWESHGLLDPALSRYQRSLALFGMPLSSTQPETNAAGDTVITQWFERARFEYHPGNPPEFRVLLGLLGTEVLGAANGAQTLPTGSVWVYALDNVIAAAPSAPSVTLSKGQGLSTVAAAPDGSLIAYYQHTQLGREGGKLWGLDPRTGQRRVLYEAAGTVTGLQFSPDSSHMAVSVVTSFESSLLVEVEVGSGRSRVINRSGDNTFLGPVEWGSAGLVVERRRWGTDAPPEDLMTIDPATGTTRTLFRGWHWGAQLSDDGKRVAVVSGNIGMGQDPEMSLRVIAVDTGQETMIVRNSRQVLLRPEWSPDGSRLAYRMFGRDGAAALHVVRADGSEAQTLAFNPTATPGRFMDARWRDGLTLAVVTGLGKETRVYDARLNAFTVAGLSRIASFAGGTDATPQIVYVP